MVAVRSLSTSIHTEAGNTNIPHNNREKEEVALKKNDHINKEKIKDNVYLKQEPIEEVYEEVFGKSLEKYNKKQRRKDRKIENYYEHIKNSEKTHEQREIIIQVGNSDDIEENNMDPEEAKEILEEWYEGFEERNENLIVYNAVIHMDEATPHLHLNFIPVGRDYKQGMDKQVAFNRAIKQQNPDFSKARPFNDWRALEDEELEKVMNKRNIKKKTVETVKAMPTDLFKEVKGREKEVGKREKKVDERDKKLISKVNEVNKKVKEKSQSLKDYEEDLERKEKKQSLKVRSLKNKEQRLNNKESKLKDYEEALKDSKDNFEIYIEEKDKEQTGRCQKLDDREFQLENRENSLEDGEEALKKSQESLDDYAETLQEELKENREKAINERMKLKGLMKQAHIWTAERLERFKDKLSENINLTNANLEELQNDKTKIDDLTLEDIDDLNEEDTRQL